MSNDFIPQHRWTVQYKCSCFLIYKQAYPDCIHTLSQQNSRKWTLPPPPYLFYTESPLSAGFKSKNSKFVGVQNYKAVFTLVWVMLLIPHSATAAIKAEFWEEECGIRPLNSFNWGHQRASTKNPKAWWKIIPLMSAEAASYKQHSEMELKLNITWCSLWLGLYG